jgi:exopolyphosphatase/guanosine-5'-triphosphate,3'-diphosphate pyrophosphatase
VSKTSLAPSTTWALADRPTRDIAVLDVGSNSVRLVLYRVEGRAIWTVFNEKVLAGLGRDLSQTGRLSPEGVTLAMAALRRFKLVLEGAAGVELFAVATAAVRDAADGPAFLKRVKAETGLKVRVLTGEEEAHYSALGVAAGQPRADGVVGDLGGSSLELVRLVKGKPGAGVTLPLGPLALGAPDFDAHAVRKAAAARLAPLKKRFSGGCFYAVGGAWRNLAILHMRLADYPLGIVQQYEMSAREALAIARLVAVQSRHSLDRIPGMSKKRSETLPFAALVLEAVVEQLGVSRIVISAYGLREGLVFEALPRALRRRDPLVEGCAALGARQGVAEHLGPALEAWLTPLWTTLEPVFEPARRAVLLAAACRLADMGARLHPDHRADLVFDQVLRAPVAGQTHAERAFLAVAAFARHTVQPPPQAQALEKVLSEERMQRARALGAAMRLGCDLSGRSPPLLAKATLAVEKRALVLTAQRDHADLLLGEHTTKRLAALADALDLTPQVMTA